MTNEDISIIFDIPDINTPIGQRNRLILELLYGTGIRVSELCNIKLVDINYNKKTINIIGKGNKERIVFYGDVCESILDKYINYGRNILLNNKNSYYLIIGTNKTTKISVRSIELIIDKIIKRAALKKNITPHILRHTFATHLLNEGCDILLVKEFLGHSSLDTTGIYTHVSNEKLRKVYLDSHPRAKKD
jgi:integrase/recombinase XerC